MPLKKETKTKVISDYRLGKHDTGSAEVQVALITQRINELSAHFKTHAKDHHSRYGLIKLVGQRKRFLSYLHKMDPERYKKLIARLELRK
jgi:small subunit ribosomal protein S15